MNRKNFLSLLFLLFAIPLTAIAEISLPLDTPTLEDPDDINYGKHRMPPAPIMCFIGAERPSGTKTFGPAMNG